MHFEQNNELYSTNLPNSCFKLQLLKKPRWALFCFWRNNFWWRHTFALNYRLNSPWCDFTASFCTIYIFAYKSSFISPFQISLSQFCFFTLHKNILENGIPKLNFKWFFRFSPFIQEIGLMEAWKCHRLMDIWLFSALT